SLTNAAGGSITGKVGILFGGAGGSTLTDAGSITGTGGTAVAFAGGAGLLVGEPGAVFHRAGPGGRRTGTGPLTPPGTQGIANFSGFDGYQLANGGANSLTLAAANFAGAASSTITVEDGDSGNAVDASAALAADTLILKAGAGADKVTGGPGNNVYDF